VPSLTEIERILAEVLAHLHGTVPEPAAREFLAGMMTATLRLEQHDVPAAMAPVLMGVVMGQFIGDQEEGTLQDKRDVLQNAVTVLFHAYGETSGDRELVNQASKKPGREKRWPRRR
jgi:hypothetical protein